MAIQTQDTRNPTAATRVAVAAAAAAVNDQRLHSAAGSPLRPRRLCDEHLYNSGITSS